MNDAIAVRDVYDSLTRYVWLRSNCRSLVIQNSIVLGSPWESDLVQVTPSNHWIEYEIKLSVADYRADFQKRAMKFMTGFVGWENNPRNPKKHDFYQGQFETVSNRIDGNIPKPRLFYFVTPKGLLDGEQLPERYGLLEYEVLHGEMSNCKKPSRGVITSKRVAKPLPKHAKLDHQAVWNLAVKASGRLCNREFDDIASA